MAKLEKIGYGQLELNQVAFPRDGRIEAQCALDTADFHEAGVKYGENVYEDTVYAENGMILAVNNVDRTVGFPTAAENEILALNYTAEHMYDERELGSLRYFKLVPGTFYPRLGYLSIGDKFTTNTVDLDTTWDKLNIKSANLVYPGKNGYWTNDEANIATTDKVVCQIIAKTTMPDGQKALKLQVIKA